VHGPRLPDPQWMTAAVDNDYVPVPRVSHGHGSAVNLSASESHVVAAPRY
jgi:hypothetical protein